MIMPELLQSLTDAQDVVEKFAPNQNYADGYRGLERDYLPALCKHFENASPESVLDIGPGWGTMAAWFALRGSSVTIIDYRPLGHYLAEELCTELGPSPMSRPTWSERALTSGTISL